MKNFNCANLALIKDPQSSEESNCKFLFEIKSSGSFVNIASLEIILELLLGDQIILNIRVITNFAIYFMLHFICLLILKLMFLKICKMHKLENVAKGK